MKLLNCSLDESVLRGVNFLLVDTNNKFLIQKRDKNCTRFPNEYCIPGGKIETNEKALMAVLREINEETYLSVKELSKIQEMVDFLYEMDGNEYRNRLYICGGIEPYPQINVFATEGTFHWFTYEELRELPLVLDQQKIIDVIRVSKTILAPA